jgi:hypothetical protein
MENSELIKFIEEKKYDLYLQKLDEYPTDKITLIELLINLIKLNTPNNIIEDTLLHWNDEPSKIIGDLLSTIVCPIFIIKKLLKIYQDITPIELIVSQFGSNVLNINIIFYRIEEIYGKNILTMEDYKFLKDKAYILNSLNFVEWLETKIVNNTEVSKPEWVNVIEGETSKLLDYNLWREADEYEEVIPLPDVEVVKRDFLHKISVDKKSEKILDDVTKLVVQGGEYNTLIYGRKNHKYPADPNRMFGPVNRRLNNEECISGVIKGGCRMLTCMCREFEQDEDDGTEYEEHNPNAWFTGICDSCKRKISDISYALRYPILDGGFIGTYCSVDCLKINPPRPNTEIGRYIIDSEFSIIQSKGIIDRVKLKHL